jgi:hypothetical protein
MKRDHLLNKKRWKGNLKKDLRKIGSVNMNLTKVAEYGIQACVSLSGMLNLRIVSPQVN